MAIHTMLFATLRYERFYELFCLLAEGFGEFHREYKMRELQKNTTNSSFNSNVTGATGGESSAKTDGSGKSDEVQDELADFDWDDPYLVPLTNPKQDSRILFGVSRVK